jgi:hypothetical protein
MDTAPILESLLAGELTLHGRVMPASNATFVGEICGQRVVYKPVAGERPLWDFPDGTLAQREEAAYVVSEALGWNLVPPTFRRDGPHGPGMVQLWQEPDPVQEAVTLVRDTDVPDGLTFHVEPKLRTVLWGWAGDVLTDQDRAGLEQLADRLDDDLAERLLDLVTPHEVEAARRRVKRLLRVGTLPEPGQGWRAIPWPPF